MSDSESKTTDPKKSPMRPTADPHIVRKNQAGLAFDDPFAWLQADEPPALEWQRAHNRVARARARSSSDFDAIYDGIRRHSGPLAPDSRTLPCHLANRWFGLSGTQLWTSVELDDEQREIVDLANAIELAEGEPPKSLAVHSYVPSPDGSFIACGLTRGGEMAGELWVVDVASQQLLPFSTPSDTPEIPVAWLPDSSGFYRDEPTVGGHSIKLTRLEDPPVDETHFVLSSDDIPTSVAALALQVSPDGRWMIGTSEPHEHTTWRIFDLHTGDHRRFLPTLFRGECHGAWWNENEFLAIVTDDSPRGRICAIPVATSEDEATWREVLPESDAVLRTLTRVADHFALGCLVDASVRVLILDSRAQLVDEVRLDQPGASPIVRHAPTVGDRLVLSHSTFDRSPSTYSFTPSTGETRQVGPAPVHLPDLLVSYEAAVASDGTRVPYFRVEHANSDRSGPRPTLIHVYGGFNLPLVPRFLGGILPFIEAGGTYVQACLRGGGEFGREWYEAGRGERQQTTFNDLYTVAEHLISLGITTPDRLALWGRSNGGLVAGVALTQRPELWRVVIPEVPLLDMVEPFGDNGMLEVVRPTFEMDYGDPDDPTWIDTLAAYSPYHNVREGTPYPAVFQIFGAKDTGCPPFHGRKFTARLQAATSSDAPVLLRVWSDVGHSPSDTETDQEMRAEWIAFVMSEFKMPYRPAPPRR